MNTLNEAGKTMRVKVRMVYEGEYDIEVGSPGYAPATTLEECVAIDREQFFKHDDRLLLDSVGGEAVAYELLSVQEIGAES